MALGDMYVLKVFFENGDTAERLSFQLHGEQPGIIAPDVATLEGDVVAWWNTDVGGGGAQKTIHAAAISLVEVTLQRVEPFEPIVSSDATSLPIVGTAAGASTSPQDALLVSLRTGLVGRSYRGRAYLPPPSIAATSGPGHVDDAEADLTKGQFEGLISDLNGHGFTVGIFSTVHDGAPRPSPVITPVTTVLVDQIIRSQRRRYIEGSDYR